MPTRSLILGFDGMDLDVVDALGEARLPTLFRLRREGASGKMKSVQPPATLPNWTTFLTSADPAAHGVFDFTTRVGYQVHFSGGTVRELPTFMSDLDARGQACACVGFPATWPPEELENGISISGWDAPVAFEADRSFVWPPALYDSIRERFGAMRFDDIDEFNADQDGWVDALGDRLVERVRSKTKLAEWLLEGRDWDVFAYYFGESDTASHYLWSCHDPSSPRHVSGHARDGLARVYEALDKTLARLMELSGEAVEVTVVSDHGSGGSSDKVLYLNRALRDAGLLQFKPKGVTSTWPGLLKKTALSHLPPRVREALFRFRDAALPSWLESQARFSAIDFERTVAFSEELNYFPSVYLNVKGREPGGTVDPKDVSRVKGEVTAALLALRDPESGMPVVRHVWPREEIFEGPCLGRAPDLLLDLHLPDGYTYNLMPSASAPPTCSSPFRRLTPDEYLGKKGRSLPGSHRSHGVYFASGPLVQKGVEVAPSIADAAATTIARAGGKPPSYASGRVLFEMLTGSAPSLGEAKATKPRKAGKADPSKVEKRLRALGYID